MGAIVSQITSLTIVYLTVYPDADQRKHQSSASLAFVRGIHRGSVNSPYKGPVMRKMFPFDDVIMHYSDVKWPQNHFNSPTPRRFVQLFAYGDIKGNTKARFVKGIHRWPMDSLKMASNVEMVSISWRHHACQRWWLLRHFFLSFIFPFL